MSIVIGRHGENGAGGEAPLLWGTRACRITAVGLPYQWVLKESQPCLILNAGTNGTWSSKPGFITAEEPCSWTDLVIVSSSQKGFLTVVSFQTLNVS